MQLLTKGRPTGRGYPAHLTLKLFGPSFWEVGCIVCRQSVMSRESRGRDRTASFLAWHKHCGLLATRVAS